MAAAGRTGRQRRRSSRDKRGVANVIAKKNPKHATRIGTSKGFANIVSFSSAKGLIQGSYGSRIER
jgi:hypothetical protein